MIIQIICAFFSIYSFSILMNVPKRYLWSDGVIGAIGWLVYLLVLEWKGMITAVFVSAVIIAITSHIFARKLKSPVIVFLIPGLLTLVPGAGMYNSVYHLIIGKTNEAASYLIQTLETAGVIAMAIFIVDSIVYLIPKKK